MPLQSFASITAGFCLVCFILDRSLSCLFYLYLLAFKMMPADFWCISALTKITLGNSSFSEVAKRKPLICDSPKFHLISVCTLIHSYYHGEQLWPWILFSIVFRFLVVGRDIQVSPFCTTYAQNILNVVTLQACYKNICLGRVLESIECRLASAEGQEMMSLRMCGCVTDWKVFSLPPRC